MNASQPDTEMNNMNKMLLKDDGSWKRLAWFGMLSIFLCFSLFMSIFTPFPLTLAILLYGRFKGLIVGLIGLVIVGILGFKFLGMPAMVGVYLVSYVFAAAVAEIFFQNLHPVKGLMRAGVSILVAIGLFIGTLLIAVEGGPRQHILNYVKSQVPLIKKQYQSVMGQGDEAALEILGLVTKPELFTDIIIANTPKVIFVGVFFWLWALMMVVLRSNRLFLIGRSYPYTEQDLLRFRVPDWVIWPLILTLGYTLVAYQYWGVIPTRFGMNTLYCFGVFYFFQGFGVYVHFLDYVQIKGFIRSFLIVLTIVTASSVLALFGLFDMWVNFRKFFKPKDAN